MTFEERAATVEPFGFTARQARFLTTVMLHAGVCVQRQYARFAGIANGQLTRDFFARLVRDRVATPYACWRGVARVYHIHHKGLYRAIGEPDNRHRRRLVVTRATERLMVLDAVLRAPDLTWMGSEHEKVTACVHRLGLQTADLPQLTFGTGDDRTVRYFPDKLPIAVSGAELMLLFVANGIESKPFRQFLTAHRPLFAAVARGQLRLGIPRGLPSAARTLTTICEAFFAAPLRPAVLEEFRWYCQARRARERGLSSAGSSERERFLAAKRAFAGPRFFDTYRGWLQRGDGVLADLMSNQLHDKWRRGGWRLEIDILPFDYVHLGPSLAIA